MVEYPHLEKALLNCNLSDHKTISSHTHHPIEIFFLLSGTGTMVIGDKIFAAEEEAVFIINPDQPHSFSSKNDVLYASFKMDLVWFTDHANFMDSVFCIDPSSKLDGGILKQWKKYLMLTIRLQYLTDPYASIMVNSYAYQILYVLLRYLREEWPGPNDKKTLEQMRQIKIRNYLYSHYKESVSLHDLAEYMFLSDAYLSKYIKKCFGQNFLSYLNSIRMEYACIDLVRYPDRSILQVALENGFPNIGAFNKCFQSIHNNTPTQFRKNTIQTAGLQRVGSGDLNVLEKSKILVERQLSKGETAPYRETLFKGDTESGSRLEKNWNIVLNAGRISDLLRFDIQEHILYLVEMLHFQYIRVWDFFSEDMLLNIEGNAANGNYNFVKLDRVFDFLMKNHIKPFLELAFKPIVLVKTLDENLVRQPRTCVFSSLRQYDTFLNELIRHFCQRYGEDEVNNWIFELWWSRDQLDKSCEKYLRLFEHTAGNIKKHAPKASVGGAGFELLRSSRELKDFLAEWRQGEILPDFLSIYAYPYNVNGENVLIDGRRVQNEDYVKEWMDEVRAIARTAGFGDKKLYGTEWNCSVSSRNILHDSCFMGAYIIKNVLSTIGRADILAYWGASDLHSEYFDLSSILYGGEGLLSRDGIRKPAYFAFDFLNHLGGTILGYGENYIITQNSMGDYRIVCCNYKHPGILYYQEREDIQDMRRLDDIFSDHQEIQAKIVIKGIEPGRYQIKIRKINRDTGSVQDEWRRIRVDDTAGEDDIAYLKSICIPRISVQSLDCGKDLQFRTVLLEQEIQYIHIKRSI